MIAAVYAWKSTDQNISDEEKSVTRQVEHARAYAQRNPKRVAGGMIPRIGVPEGAQSWLTQADLEYYIGEFWQAGFRGGINYYRNIHRNWETTPQLAHPQITQPVLFLAGEMDLVLRGATAEQLTATMGKFVKDLRGVRLYPGVGHWVQQERPDDVNKAIIEFLKSLPTS
jgi:pimeloyl-ACP methyl ester carboxylesterase